MNKLYVVGIGPGYYEDMTIRAVQCLESCDVIIGYTVYVELMKPHFPDKKFLTTPMKREIERCHMAFREAEQGRTVAMVCSGDAGVYGMAGPILELSVQYAEVSVEVIPGVTAALSGGAVLGAPLTHDFAVISLSDLLTPWEKIAARLQKAAEADLGIVLYNPSSKKRADYLKKACSILLSVLPPDRICGTVENIEREGTCSKCCTLSELQNFNVNMFTTVFIGNSGCKKIGNYMVTGRGYPITETVTESIENQPQIQNQKAEKRKLTLLGIGMGNDSTVTLEEKKALLQAQIIFGSARILESLSAYEKPLKALYKKEEIMAYLEKHREYDNIVVAFSGDTGFYSGASEYTALTEEYEVRICPGISSMSYFAARLGVCWQDWKLLSIHGRNTNVCGHIRQNKKCFLLLPNAQKIRELGETLTEQFGTDVQVTYGYQLSYPEELICTGTPDILRKIEKPGLYVLLVENSEAENTSLTPGIRDELFLRDKVPMTKEEVRMLSVCKLRLTKRAVVYDIGAGTGSVSIECAALCPDGMVYALERDEAALTLLMKNKKQFHAENMQIIEAEAPEGMEELPIPTHAFIGGSGGHMEIILRALFRKNPKVRVVISAVSLETVGELTGILEKFPMKDMDMVQVMVSKAKKAGKYHLMSGMNPVYILSFTGK